MGLNILGYNLTVTCTAPDGTDEDYRLEELTLDPEADPWQVRVTHLLEPERTYLVTCRREAWSCECPDWRHRFGTRRLRPPGSPCKHIDAATEVREVLAALRPAPVSQGSCATAAARQLAPLASEEEV